MFTSTNLISVQDFGNYVTVSKFVTERDYFLQLIQENQIIHIPPIVCDDLYGELILQKKTSSLTSLNSKLIFGDGGTFRGIAAYLIYLTFSDYILLSGIESTRSGLKRLADERSEDITEKERAELIREYRGRAEISRLSLIDYLEKNKNLYPLYNCKNCDQIISSNPFENISAVKKIRKYKNLPLR